MITKTKGNISLLLFPNLMHHSELRHAISTRNGGVSTGPYTSLNLSFSVGDEPHKVMNNHQLLSQVLGFELNTLTTAHQVHQDRIALIDESYLTKDSFHPDHSIPDTDALVTDVPGITLMTRHADCVPLLLYDPHQKVAALVHAGWKGTLAQISLKTVTVLAKEYHCQPHHLHAAIGPSVGPCCYHVNSTVAQCVEKELPRADHYLRESPDGVMFFDLWLANRRQLEDAGVKGEHIYCTHLCTSCHVDMFFSHRKEKGLTGRFGAIIGLIK